MDKQNEQQPSTFVDFASFQNVRVTKTGKRGSVLKADSVEWGNARKIEIESHGASQPEIILHRDGEIIERVEVVCTCG